MSELYSVRGWEKAASIVDARKLVLEDQKEDVREDKAGEHL